MPDFCSLHPAFSLLSTTYFLLSYAFAHIGKYSNLSNERQAIMQCPYEEGASYSESGLPRINIGKPRRDFLG